jgi:DNA topoisomerase-1
MIAFGRALPSIRKRVGRDLRVSGFPRRKVIAAMVYLLDKTLLRIGNDEYARTNGSYGLTTLLNRHAEVRGASLRLCFRGKTGRIRHVSLESPRLARIVKRCLHIPGQRLFQYLDSKGRPRAVGSSDVNRYLRDISREDFSAKDFRTWGGTKLAASLLASLPREPASRGARRAIARVLENVAGHMGNTPSICRKCYVHPALLEAYETGAFRPGAASPRERIHGELPDLEAELLAFLDGTPGARPSNGSAEHFFRRPHESRPA